MLAVCLRSVADAKAQKSLSYREQYVNICLPRIRRPIMLIIDATILLAVAAIITASSTLIWSIRRKP